MKYFTVLCIVAILVAVVRAQEDYDDKEQKGADYDEKEEKGLIDGLANTAYGALDKVGNTVDNVADTANDVAQEALGNEYEG